MTGRATAASTIARLGRKVATLTAQVVVQGVRIDELREERDAQIAALERANQEIAELRRALRDAQRSAAYAYWNPGE